MEQDTSTAVLRPNVEEPEPTPQDLHSRFITHESHAPRSSDLGRPALEIFDDEHLAVQGARIPANRTIRFFFNILQRCQGEPLTGSQIRSAGYEGSADAFQYHVRKFLATLGQLSNEELIEHTVVSRPRTYAYTLLSNVRVADLRETQKKLSAKERLIRDSVVPMQDGTPLVRDNLVVFKGPAQHEQVAARMMRDFKSAASADDQLSGLLEPSALLSLDGTMRSQQGDRHPKLTRREEDTLLTQKEQALTTYTVGGETYSAAETTIIHQGVRAYYKLFRANLGIVRALAIRYDDGAPLQELYQECAEELLRLILRQRVESSQPNFNVVAAGVLRQRAVTRVTAQEIVAPVSYPARCFWDSYHLRDRVEALQAEGTTPDFDTLAAEFGVQKDKILGLWALSKGVVRLDEPAHTGDPDGATIGHIQLKVNDSFDTEFLAIEREEAIDTLFRDKALTGKEKVVLSLHYQIFHASLCGFEVRNGEKSFVYPYTEDAFLKLTNKKLELTTISRDIFGKADSYARPLHRHALRKGRDVLATYEGLEMYGNNCESDRSSHANERQTIVLQALELSPDKPLAKPAITTFYRAGKLPAVSDIIRLFGSMTDFKIACGFRGSQRVSGRPAYEAKSC